jgi:hypothetical protein
MAADLQDPARQIFEKQCATDDSLIDAKLSALGRQQCSDALDLVLALPDILTVFVSPLRRAIETAFLLFSQSIQFPKIKFIVLPLLRENMHTICDVPVDFSTVVDEWAPKFPSNIDFSLVADNNWFLADLNKET